MQTRVSSKVLRVGSKVEQEIVLRPVWMSAGGKIIELGSYVGPRRKDGDKSQERIKENEESIQLISAAAHTDRICEVREERAGWRGCHRISRKSTVKMWERQYQIKVIGCPLLGWKGERYFENAPKVSNRN